MSVRDLDSKAQKAHSMTCEDKRESKPETVREYSKNHAKCGYRYAISEADYARVTRIFLTCEDVGRNS
jgi:hypothetical protein